MGGERVGHLKPYVISKFELYMFNFIFLNCYQTFTFNSELTLVNN
jgi:hypothetical protein